MRIKRKGAYEYKVGWHQDHSALVIPKAAEAALIHGTDIRHFIENHTDVYDFLLRTKVPRSSSLLWIDYDGTEHRQQNVTRYYVSVLGGDLVKVMPPTAKMTKEGKDHDRRISFHAGWKVTPCNDIRECNPDDIEFDYYVREAEKLVNPILGRV